MSWTSSTYFFPFCFLQCSPSLRCRVCVVDVSAGAGCPWPVVCSVSSGGFVMISVCCKKKLSLMRGESIVLFLIQGQNSTIRGQFCGLEMISSLNPGASLNRCFT